MTDDTRYRAHKVRREDRADGSILLHSGYEISPIAKTTGDWLHGWAETAPDRVFIAERSGPGWRELSYAEVLQQVRAIGAALVGRGMGPGTPILVMSGNGVDHGLLALAAQYVGIPLVPVAEQYALIPGAHGRLKHAVELVKPGMVYADDATRYADALALPEIAALDRLVSANAGPGMLRFEELLKGDAGVEIDTVHAGIGPDTVAKYLLTSGSTSNPKAVITTHGMMCANQAQLLDALPFLGAQPPRIVDWLPWNHVFGGSHNFNMMLANGGSLYIDDGKPTPALIGRTLENMSMKAGTIWFNVPLGFGMVTEAMKSDEALRRAVFSELDMIFYAGASLPQDVWTAMEDMAREVRGALPLMTSSWGLTETAPATMLQHEPTDRSGIVGVPLTGVTTKLIPDADMRCEVRVKGPNIMPGYFEDAAKTAEAFDEEGFFITGDAMVFVDPDDMSKGMKFDGRISEDFKLQTGTWVRAAGLRMEALKLLDGIASDLVITGADRKEIGLLIFPNLGALKKAGFETDTAENALIGPKLREEIKRRLVERAGEATGSAALITRALVLAEPPSMGDGEMTAKGNLNFRKVLTRRAELLERLYDDADPAVITIKEG
ncbi:feruloyl-CoA synthase [Oceanicola sp. 502str15]|uniref:feruloyl-CoA synthase n=1 Tax=Oceanicola sp. 502str15 TaxID=2696061 RepID=UPI002094BBE8|nr:feruloyl-CoA synthase [Oceanicola sp. 502str15]MCO6384055.1 AMP-binding protein [Oceanicola sp. 502str15]